MRGAGPAVTRLAGHAPVLMYHGVGEVEDDPFGLFVGPGRFARQMATLAALGLHGVSLAELGDAAGSGRVAGLVGLTFDDGYRELLRWAPGVLHRHGFTATVFVVSGLLGKENVWDPPPRRPLVTADDVGSLARQGWEIGSHGLTHVELAGLDPGTLLEEVAGSRAALADLTGSPPRSFCYPYGSTDRAAVDAVRSAGYRYACAVRRVPGLPVPLAYPRVGVMDRDHPARFALKLVLRGR